MQRVDKDQICKFAYEVERSFNRLLGVESASWDYLSGSEKMFLELAVDEVRNKPNMAPEESYAGRKSERYLLDNSECPDWELLSSGEKAREILFLSTVKAALLLNQEEQDHG